eukprot:jgi/Ulvmu1/9618/UM054_0048.1
MCCCTSPLHNMHTLRRDRNYQRAYACLHRLAHTITHVDDSGIGGLQRPHSRTQGVPAAQVLPPQPYQPYFDSSARESCVHEFPHALRRLCRSVNAGLCPQVPKSQLN